MEMTFKDFDKRIEILQNKIKNWIEFHARIEKKIDFVRFNKWLREHPKAEVHCEVYDIYSDKFVIHVSNVPLDEFIENVLGPYHRKFNINWKMELEGSEEEAVFIFYDVRQCMWGEENFRVKEGDFKSCQIVKAFSHMNRPKSTAVYNLEMVCE